MTFGGLQFFKAIICCLFHVDTLQSTRKLPKRLRLTFWHPQMHLYGNEIYHSTRPLQHPKRPSQYKMLCIVCTTLLAVWPSSYTY